MAKIKYEVDGFAAAKPADLKKAQKQSFEFIGKLWHRKYKALHFTNRGATKYGYKPRSGERGSGRGYVFSYVWHKVKVKKYEESTNPIGQNQPLVWSGTTRSLAMSANKVKAAGNNKGQGSVEIIIRAPVLNFPNPRTKIPLRAELIALTVDEMADFQTQINRVFEKNVLRIRRKKTVTKN